MQKVSISQWVRGLHTVLNMIITFLRVAGFIDDFALFQHFFYEKVVPFEALFNLLRCSDKQVHAEFWIEMLDYFKGFPDAFALEAYDDQQVNVRIGRGIAISV